MGVTAAISRAGQYISAGKLKLNSTSSSSTMLAFHNAFFGLASNLIYLICMQNSTLFSSDIFKMRKQLWVLYTILSILGTLHVVFITVALKLINPILVSFTRSSDIFVAYLVQVLYFNQSAGMLDILGSICIVTSIGILQFEEYFIQRLPNAVQFLF